MSLPIDELKNRLKQALIIRNIKPIELSEKTGIPKSAISQYTSGYAKPKQDRIYLICKALDINEAWLLGYDIPMERTSNELTSREQKEMDCNLIEKCYGSKAYELVELFIKLNDIGKAKAIEELSDMVQLAKYTKHEKRENAKMA